VCHYSSGSFFCDDFILTAKIAYRGRRNQTEQPQKGTKCAKTEALFLRLLAFLRPSKSSQDEAIRIYISIEHKENASSSLRTLPDYSQTKTNMFVSMLWADFKRGARGERGE
jgi:hypothetical protein